MTAPPDTAAAGPWMSETPTPETSESVSPDMLARVWARIKEHKVIQWTLGYLAAALALAHGAELVSQGFEWPHAIFRIVIALLVLGLPIAVALAWYHGHRGLRRVSQGEAMIVSLLLIICAVLLVVFVQPPAEREATSAGDTKAANATAEKTSSLVVPAGSAALKPSGKPRIAILPFENLSPDPDNAFFTDGMHEEILSTLANAAPGLEVVSRTTMMLYRAAPKPVAEIAEELGATHILEGTVRRAGDHVRLTLQLIDGASDKHIWSQDYDRTLKDALALQSEVASEVAAQLSVQLAPHAQAAGAPTTDPVAYDLYLKARLALGQLVAVQPIAPYRDVEALLTKAIARDRDFTLAYVERFSLHLLFFLLNYDPSQERLDLAGADLDAARRLAPNHPSVIAAEAQYAAFAEGNFDRALSLFAEAERRGLADPNLLQREASLLNMVGRHEEALALYARLVPLDPGNAYLLLTWELDLVAAHQPAEAFRVLDLARAHLSAGLLERVDTTHALQRFWFTGRFEPDSVDNVLNFPVSPDNESVSGSFLRARHRYREIIERLDKSGEDSIRITLIANLPAFAVGRMPIADLRGWVHLLLDDDAAAARDGRAVSAFVEKQEEAEWNAWFLRLLTADARLFSGDQEGSTTAAREALAMAASRRSLFDRTLAKYLAAQVLAWSNAKDEAIDLLEELGQPSSALAPGLITRDPVFTVPLEGNARYKALSQKLETQMAATKLE